MLKITKGVLPNQSVPPFPCLPLPSLPFSRLFSFHLNCYDFFDEFFTTDKKQIGQKKKERKKERKKETNKNLE